MGQMARHGLERLLVTSFAYLTSNNYRPNYPALGGLLYSDRTDGPTPRTMQIAFMAATGQSTHGDEGGEGEFNEDDKGK